MRRAFLTTVVMFLLFYGLAAAAEDEWTSFLKNINLQAQADASGFKARLSAQFKLPMVQVEAVLKDVETPADAYMCLRIGELTNKPPEVILKEYKKNKGKGWGVMAKEMGIKPGSKEFHELKKGGPGGQGDKDKKGGPGPGKDEKGGQDKGRGKGKDK